MNNAFSDGQPQQAVQQAVRQWPPPPQQAQQQQQGAPLPVQLPHVGGAAVQESHVPGRVGAQHQPWNADASLHQFAFLAAAPSAPVAAAVTSSMGAAPCKNPFLNGQDDLLRVADITTALPGVAESSDDEDLNPDYMPAEQPGTGIVSPEETSVPTSGATAGVAGDGGGGGTLVLSRQDTWKYLEDLQSPNWPRRVECTRALKFLAFNADAEYKEGLIRGGLCRVLVQMLSVYLADASMEGNATAVEHAASCMYSMAREHQPSKLELLKLNAPRRLVELLSHGSKQLRLNACAALYAISCAGRGHCRDIALIGPMSALQAMITPKIGRNAQDEQLQLFASLLIVNLLHSRGGAVPKHERCELLDSLRRAYDDANELQARAQGTQK